MNGERRAERDAGAVWDGCSEDGTSGEGEEEECKSQCK